MFFFSDVALTLTMIKGSDVIRINTACANDDVMPMEIDAASWAAAN
jgi:hypothetical protein